jgi:hypothetical protein
LKATERTFSRSVSEYVDHARTAVHPPGQPFGPGHRCVPPLPARGDLILDMADGRIMYIEIPDRPPVRRRGAVAGVADR